MSNNFYPYLNTMPQLDGAIQIGRGVAASVIGQPYNIYRNSSTTNNSILANAPTFVNFPSRLRRIVSKNALEDAIFDLQMYQATCDNRLLEFGDLCTEQGYESQENNIYAVAGIRPTRETIWARVESNCFISRPMPTAGQAIQLPASGAAAVQGYGGYQKDTEQILTLINGDFGFFPVLAAFTVNFTTSVLAFASNLGFPVSGTDFVIDFVMNGNTNESVSYTTISSDTSSTVATAIAAAINALSLSNVTATSSGPNVTLSGAAYTNVNASSGVSEASIPCGIQQTNRISDASKPKFPTTLYRERFLVYVPDLPGEQLTELDRLNLPNSDRYEIASILNTEGSGLHGYVCIVERLGV